MFTPDLVLGTATYSLTAQRVNSSIRGDASQPLSEPNLLTISHENAKNGRRSSVIILDDTKIVGGTTIVPSTVRTLLKLQFNPLEGRTDIETALAAQIAEVVEFLSNPALVAKILNQET